jgi:hypothetical protein
MRKVKLGCLLTASVLGALAGCADKVAPDASTAPGVSSLGLPLQACNTIYSPPGIFRAVDPVALLAGAASDCAVGTNASPCAPHHVYTPNPMRVREPLFLFLPGTNMEPDKHDLVMLTAASVGYRTIGLSYDNTVAENDACAGLEACGQNCTGLVREEVTRGVDLTPRVSVARGDSVLVRLYRVLAHLDAIDPAGGWSSYYVPTAGTITPSNIVWDNIIVGGFSQGGSVAAFISWTQQVHGLFVLDAANDTCIDPVTGDELPAEWLSAGADASAGRPKYGFRHDHGTGDTITTATWQTLGLGTPLFDVDCTAAGCISDVLDIVPPPHASVTAQGHPPTPPAPRICSDHTSMARDECMPTDIGGATAATAATDYRLYRAYAQRLCYACDAVICP